MKFDGIFNQMLAKVSEQYVFTDNIGFATDSEINEVYFESPFIFNGVVAAAERQYAEYSHTEKVGNKYINHYNIRLLFSYKMNIKGDFEKFINRDFPSNVAEIFGHKEDQDEINYLVMLFQYFVHEGDRLPLSLSEVAVLGTYQLKAHNISSEYSSECAFYTDPTVLFQKTYPNWKTDLGVVFLSDSIYPLARKQDMILSEELKKQYVTPLLQNMIKLWIIHRVGTLDNKAKLSEHCFFNAKGEDLELTLMELQNKIKANMSRLFELSIPARKKLASVARVSNKYALSPHQYALAQHIPLLKLIVGHANYDVHKISDDRVDYKSKCKFYINTYLHLIIIKFLIRKTYQEWREAKGLMRQFISKDVGWRSLGIALLKGLSAVYLAVLLPFFSILLITSGLTSLPFSLLRKRDGFSFSGRLDKALTGLEAIKDLALVFTALPVAISLYAGVAALSFGTVGLGMGTNIAYYGFFFVASPWWGINKIDTYFAPYPKWVIHNGSKKRIWMEESPFSIGQKWFSSHPVVNSNAALIGLVTVGFIAYLVVAKTVAYFKPKRLNSTELREQTQGLNHSILFRKLLGILASNLETGKMTKVDFEALAAISKCVVDKQEKEVLRQFIKQKLDDPVAVEKNVFRLELPQLNKKSYFPSSKVIACLNRELLTAAKGAPIVKMKPMIEKLNTVYEKELPKFCAP